jgi:hypothetical protein
MSLTKPARSSLIMRLSEKGLAMLDREVKELYIGCSMILIFAMALVYFQQ